MRWLGLILGVVLAAPVAAQLPGDPACDGENGPPPPYCRKAESCEQYAARMAAPCAPSPLVPSGQLCGHRLWAKWWCTISGGRCNQTTGRRPMRPYFVFHWHGCSCQGQPQVPGIGPGENHPCWKPDPAIFSDDFETGTLDAWDAIVQ